MGIRLIPLSITTRASIVILNKNNMKKIITILIAFCFFNIVSAQSHYSLSVDINYDSIFSLDGKFFAVKQNGKWGVVKDQKEIIPCQFEGIDALGDGVISYINNNKIGFADTLGNILLEATYPIEKQSYREDFSQINVFDNGAALVEVEGRYQLIDKQNKQIIPQEYEICSRIGDAVAIKKNGKYGIANSKGKILLYPQYLDIAVLIEGKLYSYKTINTSGFPMFGLINGKGEIISGAIYADFGIYNGKKETYLKAYTEQGGQALLDDNGKIIIPPIYQVILPTILPKYFAITQNLEEGIIGKDSVIYVPPAYERVEIKITNDTFFLAHKENKTFIYDDNQNHIATIEGTILDIANNKNGQVYFVIEKNFSYGIQNAEGKWIIEPIYDEILSIVSDNICFRKKDKWGVVNMKNEVIVPFQYKEAKPSPSKKFFVLYDGKKDSKLLNTEGEIISFAKTESIMITNNYIEYKEKKQRQRVYATTGDKPSGFLSIKGSSNGIAVAKTPEGFSYYNEKDFKPLTNTFYQGASIFFNGQALVYKDNKLKVIDNNFHEKAVLLEGEIDNLEMQLNNIGLRAFMGADYYIIKNKKKYGVITIKQ